jgi:small subunit ribosomal protein S16
MISHGLALKGKELRARSEEQNRSRPYSSFIRNRRFGGEALAIAIRLKRLGRKKRPFYRVIVADERNPRQGKAVDDLGYYDPLTDPIEIQINEEKALIWLKEGAKPTETARRLLSKAGILKKLHEQVHIGSPTAKKEDETPQTAEQANNEDSEQEEP